MDATLMVNASVPALNKVLPLFCATKLMVKLDPASLTIPTVNVVRADASKVVPEGASKETERVGKIG